MGRSALGAITRHQRTAKLRVIEHRQTLEQPRLKVPPKHRLGRVPAA